MEKRDKKGIIRFPIPFRDIRRKIFHLRSLFVKASISGFFSLVSTIMILPVNIYGGEVSLLPSFTLKQCKSPPFIDGKLNDDCWQNAVPVNINNIVGTEKTTSKHIARITSDKEWLYIAFDVNHPLQNRKSPEFFNHDDYVQREDCIQVSFDPGTNGDLYYHFLLNTINTRAEQRMTRKKGRELKNWNIPWRSATQLTQDGWTAELALPLSIMTEKGDVNKAKINLIVTSFIPHHDSRNSKTEYIRKKTSWSPLISNFHEPDRFGSLHGLCKINIKKPFLPNIFNPRIEKYYYKNGQLFYNLIMDVKESTPASGKIIVEVTDIPDRGKRTITRKEILISGNTRRRITVPISTENLLKRNIRFVVSDPVAGGIWRQGLFKNPKELVPFSAYLDRNYYTNEKKAFVVCRVSLPPEALENTIVKVQTQEGEILGLVDKINPETLVPLAIKNLPAGTHDITVTLEKKKGAQVAIKFLKLVKRVPKPGCEWKIDQENKIVLNNGKPFFPFGFFAYGMTPAYRKQMNKQCMALAEAGFNTVCAWYGSRLSPAKAGAYIDIAKKYGLYVIFRPEAYSTGTSLECLDKYFSGAELEQARKDIKGIYFCKFKNLTAKSMYTKLSRNAKNKIFEAYYLKMENRMFSAVRRVVNDKNLIGYNLFDEPHVASLGRFDQNLMGMRFYRKIYQIDGYHPCMLNYSSLIPEVEQAINWTDILMTDPYWKPAGTGAVRSHRRCNINWVSYITWNTKRRADERQKVAWIVLMSDYWSGTDKRINTKQEQICQTYLALIHGAKGILYFRTPLNREIWQTLVQLAGEMKIIGRIVTTPELSQKAVYMPGEMDEKKFIFPDVQVKLFNHPDGGYVLLAANSKSYPVEVKYRLSCLKNIKKVKHLFKNKFYKVSGNSFSDVFPMFGVAAYRIKSGENVSSPVDIIVNMTTHRDKKWREKKQLPRTGRPRKKNILRNPSFEECTVKGWPDYFRYYWASGPVISPSDSTWGIDTCEAYHGKQSLRITSGEYKQRLFSVCYLQPSFTVPTRCIFSIYMKSEKSDTEVELCAFNTLKKFKLTTEWKRYELPVTVPPRAGKYSTIQIRGDSKPVFWIDAAQFEVGETATEFEP